MAVNIDSHDDHKSVESLAEMRIETDWIVEVVSDYDELLDMKPAWDALLQISDIDHPFVSHEWVCSWWECFGAGRALYVLRVYYSGKLVAVVPLMLSVEYMYGFRVRRIGTLYNEHTPRFDCVVARGYEESYQTVWKYLHDHHDDWDMLEFCQLPAESETIERLETLVAPHGYRVSRWQSSDSPYLPISGTWSEYYSGLRRKHRSNLRNRLKRLNSLGTSELECVSSPDLVPAALTDGLRLEAAAWKGAAGTAIAVLPDVERFYRSLADKMARCGGLRLGFLKMNHQRIAFGYSLGYHNRLYLLKVGYDPAYATISPSIILCSMLLRDAFESHLTEFDFLGSDDAWKLSWTSQLRAHAWLYVFARTPRALLLYSIKFKIIPKLRQMRLFLHRLQSRLTGHSSTAT